MIDLEITNINKINKWKLKAKKMGATGLVIFSTIPCLIGCRKDTNYTEQQHVYYAGISGNSVTLSPEASNIDLEDLKENGKDIKSLYLSFCNYIDDLSIIVEYCPNLEILEIDRCPSIADLSFIYSLPNLKKVIIVESGYVTPELIEYLDSKGIEHNLTNRDLENTEALDNIISEIITEDMTDEEKIQAIVYYVIDNYKYKKKYQYDSNSKPLSCMFDNNGGVCASFAYFTNILLRKAGVNSCEVDSEDHAWVMVEVEGKYYYIDITNINQIPYISKLIIKHLNYGMYYMSDPGSTFISAMEDYDNIEKVSIPLELIEDIERGEDEKTIIEKYGNSVPVVIIELLIAIIGISLGVGLTAKGISAVANTISYNRYSRHRKKRQKQTAKRRKKELEEYEGEYNPRHR